MGVKRIVLFALQKMFSNLLNTRIRYVKKSDKWLKVVELIRYFYQCIVQSITCVLDTLPLLKVGEMYEIRIFLRIFCENVHKNGIKYIFIAVKSK